MPKKSIMDTGLRWLWIAAIMLGVDIYSKHWVLQNLNYQQPWELLPIFNFTLVFNKGAAFSMLNAQSGWQHWLLGGLATIVALFIVGWLGRLHANKRWQGIALSLILSGAVGNLIDRLRFGYVIDFLDFHIGDWHFAIFNVADSCICVGAFMLIIYWALGKE